LANKLVHQLIDKQALGSADITALKNFIGQHTPFINWLKKHFLHHTYLENQDLILEALTHSSFSHENKDWPLRDNERLEFLGDAILDGEISHRLFTLFPTFSEGDLSRLRSAVVNEEILAQWACLLKVDHYIMLGRGEAAKPVVGQAILADAFEAIIGALHLIDPQGLSRILDQWIKLFDENSPDGRAFFCPSRLEDFDPKTRLQEVCLEHFRAVAHYKTILKEERGQEMIFSSDVFCEDNLLGSGLGSSKKKAQGAAAKDALHSQTLEKLTSKKKQ